MGSTLGCSIVDTRPRTEMRSPVGNRVVILQGNHQNKQHCSAAAEIGAYDALPRSLTLVFAPGAWMVSSYPTVVTGACPSLDVSFGVARCPSG